MPECSKGGNWTVSIPSNRTRRAMACAGVSFESLDFLGCATESSPLQQVRREIVIPILGAHRVRSFCQFAGPAHWAIAAVAAHKATTKSCSSEHRELLVTCLGICSHESPADARGCVDKLLLGRDLTIRSPRNVPI